MKAIKVLDYNPRPIDMYKGNWGLWDVEVEMEDGSRQSGSMQGDTYNWAFETFERDE